MKIVELEKILQEIDVPSNAYSILKGGLPNEQLCIVKEDNIWEVYYSERGRKSSIKKFYSEEEACIYFFNKIKKYARKEITDIEFKRLG